MHRLRTRTNKDDALRHKRGTAICSIFMVTLRKLLSVLVTRLSKDCREKRRATQTGGSCDVCVFVGGNRLRLTATRGGKSKQMIGREGLGVRGNAQGTCPPILSLEAQISREDDDGGGRNTMMCGGLGVGRLEQHCPIYILKPHPNRGTLPEEEVWYPGVEAEGGDFQTQPLNGVK